MRGKILVVIEDATIRSALESLLKEQGLDVFSFNTTQKSLDWLSLSRPDLIILDSSLPEPPAATVCQRIRKDQKLANVPIIILLTTLEEVRDEEELGKAGASNFVVQPFNPRELLEKVEIYLLEKAATSSQDLAAAPLNHKAAPAGKLGNIFTGEEALDLDSILSEGMNAKDIRAPEDLLKPVEDELEIQAIPRAMDFEPEVRPREPSQHDYNWFLSEMQGEVQGGKKEETPAPASSQMPSQPPISKKSPEQLRVQARELGTSEMDYEKLAAQLNVREVARPDPTPPEAEFNAQVVLEDETPASAMQINAPGASKKQETTKSVPGGGTDYERITSELTEKIADRLAKELVQRLKPETILQLLKEELEKGKS